MLYMTGRFLPAPGIFGWMGIGTGVVVAINGEPVIGTGQEQVETGQVDIGNLKGMDTDGNVDAGTNKI
jgi:hypothetical protein